jgi:hypothetical protein
VEKDLENTEREMLLAISRLGNQAYGDAVLHAAGGPSSNEAASGESLRTLEQKGLISPVATTHSAQSGADRRYVLTAEGRRVLEAEKENLAGLRAAVDRRIEGYYRRLRSKRKAESKKLFWSGIGWK